MLFLSYSWRKHDSQKLLFHTVFSVNVLFCFVVSLFLSFFNATIRQLSSNTRTFSSDTFLAKPQKIFRPSEFFFPSLFFSSLVCQLVCMLFVPCLHSNLYFSLSWILHLIDARANGRCTCCFVQFHYKRKLFFWVHLHFKPLLAVVNGCDGVISIHVNHEFSARFEFYHPWFFFAADLRYVSPTSFVEKNNNQTNCLDLARLT